MKNTQLDQHIRALLNDVPLPDPNALIAQGRAIANDITLGRSLFCQEMGVASEAEYKAQCKRDGAIMYHAHVGMGSWPATVEALHHIYRVAQDEGYVIDRAGICLDRRMAVPAEFRAGIPAETGPMLTTRQAWREVGQVVPIQPHMGDFMIGFPAATANTVQALQAGVTTIGNLSQYFAHEAPTWNDPITTVAETVRAIAILGRRREEGLVLHSCLEDGFGALFFDCVTVAGWAYLERHIVETLLGARLAHCIGGLTSDPIKRVGWIAVQLLYVLKRLGPAQFEATFGLGEWDPTAGRRKPLVPTDIFDQSLQTIAQYTPQFSSGKMRGLLGKRRLLLASTDVHAHAIFVLEKLLRQAGAEVVNLGAEQNPIDVAKAAQAHDVEAILISTHNGMALEYAQRLQAELDQRRLELPLLMGGVLNQKVSHQPLPVDVTAELRQLGVHTSAQLDRGWGRLLPPGESSC
jgi:methylmalonyl-CoA mutase cobalamin-binding subunit